jgi:hydrogenase maturation factor
MTTGIADERITLKHGAGGRARRRLIVQVFTRGVVGATTPGTVGLSALDDGAAVPIGDAWLVVTTTRMSSTRCSFPAATSAGWRCRGRSTISR